ncbi:hypothetical protein PZ897_10145 [Hoeflea sp. YIM 152468]|uniref:hypothetical protein n=1 Tax=Hoeflea sp. YIM 152468 TaxID=3031759 RepID=UPI0023D99021|nr:hypothetical protein [Hoeflea sp. YIM 152468]MDF1608536.1 hypothetical protein [Hoeflea sp. YIM 152468]
MIGIGHIFSRTGLVRLVCALSLLFVAFAHIPLSANASAVALQFAYADVDISDFILPDGTLADLCLRGEGSGEQALGSDCDACRIVSAFDLPVLLGGYLANRISAQVLLAPGQSELAPRQVLRPGASPRGPPVFRV